MRQLPFVLLTFCVLLITSLFSSCSLERRHYRSGYHIETNFGKGNTIPRDSSDFDIPALKQKVPQVGHSTYGSNIPENNNLNLVSAEPGENGQILPSGDQASLSIKIESTPQDTLNRSLLQKNLPSPAEYGLAEDAPRVTGFAIAALVLGILCLFTGFVGSIICAILAVIFGLIALNKIRQQPDKWKGKGMAWAGYICALVGLTIWSIYFMLY